MKQFSSLSKLKAFYLLVLIPAFYSCTLLSVDKTKPVKIHIKKGNINNGNLTLRNWIGHSEYTVDVDAGATVRWRQQAPEVSAITNIYEKHHDPKVFSTPPHPVAGTQDWEAVMDSTASVTVDYNIDWLDKKGKSHTCDPKIAVKPGTSIDFIKLAILIALIVISSIPTVRFFRRRKIRNKLAKNDPQNT